jgi:multiple sugar transport system permease protein
MGRIDKKKALAFYASLCILMFILVSPFAWLVIQSFQTYTQLCVRPPNLAPYWPDPLRNYRVILFGEKVNYTGFAFASATPEWVYYILPALKNSAIVAISSTLISLALASFSAFTFAKMKFRGKNKLLNLTLVVRMIPATSIIIPLWIVMYSLRLVDSVWGLILLYSSTLLPYNIWMLKTFFQTIPDDLVDASSVDGCNRLQTLLRVVLPVSKPGLVAVGIFNFMLCWNEFFFALIMTKSIASYTAPVVTSMFSLTVQSYIPFDIMLTAGVISSLPPIICAMVFQKYLIKGLLMGAIK